MPTILYLLILEGTIIYRFTIIVYKFYFTGWAKNKLTKILFGVTVLLLFLCRDIGTNVALWCVYLPAYMYVIVFLFFVRRRRPMSYMSCVCNLGRVHLGDMWPWHTLPAFRLLRGRYTYICESTLLRMSYTDVGVLRCGAFKFNVKHSRT